MSERLQGVIKQLGEFWGALPGPRRIGLVTATVGVLLAVLAVAHFGSRSNYGVLYTDLTTEDAGSIAAKLKEQDVPFRISAGGTVLSVPEDQVHSLRLELASDGLPRGGGMGFELFDESRLGATEFEQRVNLRRALEGELARSIASLEGVSASRVHLVLPERRLFVRKEGAASASVVVKLGNNAAFGKREVAGVVHLVSAAVAGLSPNRVSVVRSDGMTLHRPSVEGSGIGGGSSDSVSERAQEMATEMETHARGLLERVVGLGAAEVRVHVDLDSTSQERTAERFEPERSALRSEHRTDETSGTQGATIAGIPGARSNLPAPGGETPDVPSAIADEDAKRLTRSTHTRNWELDRITERTLFPAGSIRRISVAVLVDGKYEERNGESVFVPRGDAELAQLGEVVRGSLGYDAARGDTFSIQGAQFARTDFAEAPVIVAPVWKQYVPYGVAGVGAVVLLALLLVVGRLRKGHQRAVVETKLREIEAAEIAAQLESASTRELDESPAREAVHQIAKDDPATAAVVLRAWLESRDPNAA